MAKFFLFPLRTVITLFVSLNCFFTYGQTPKIDSLRIILPGAAVTEKIDINYRIGSEFFNSYPDSAIHYYNEALKLAREMKNDSFTAKCLNKIGTLNYNSGEYEKAIGNLYSALKIFERFQDKERMIRCLQYLGKAYNEQGMSDKAIDFAKQSIEIAREINDSASMSVGFNSIGSVYYSQSNYDKALEYFEEALLISKGLKRTRYKGDALNNIALIYEEKKNFSKALEYHLISLALSKELGDSRRIAASYHNIGLVYQGLKKFPIAIQYLDSSIMLSTEGDDKFYLKESYNSISELYSNSGNFEKAYQAHLLYSQLNDTLMSEENKKQFAEMNTKYETDKKDNQIILLNKDKELGEEKMRKEKIIRNGFMGGFAIVLLFAGVFFRQRNKIKKGKQRSDELLLNILPWEVAEELKMKGESEAKYFDEVTVMFTDFKNFTQASEKLSATELVKEIHHCYSEFDKIISRFNLEKIKTIGDSYMCAGGLPVPNMSNAEDTVKAALAIRDFMELKNQKYATENKPFFEIRIGCHTGAVVAGIVGIKKFAYDIWGDTVNIASRMEQNGEAGKINISGATYAQVKDKYKCLHRGKIEAKNKGEIDMYFVEEV